MSSEVNLITTLQNEVKELTQQVNELKTELESYKKKKRFWSFTFYIRNIFK